MKYRVPIDLLVDATSPEEARVRVDEFMTRAVSEYRRDYFLVDFEVPWGYPVEEV